MASKLRINVVSYNGDIKRVITKNICNNPKTCTTRKHIGGGHYICDHYNLAILYPEIAKEWDYGRNVKFPEEFSPYSNKKVWWKCSKEDICECHQWEATISNRTNIKSNCPFCNFGRVCKHYNFKVCYPEIAKEWDYGRNKILPEECSPKSTKCKYWWKCSKPNVCECHRWEATLPNRAYGTGCPYCKGLPCEHYNFALYFPEKAAEWDYKRNKKNPEEYTPYSDALIWWNCRDNVCGCHIWQTSIGNRYYSDTDCPFCVRSKLCPHNNLAYLYPEVAREWNYEKNEFNPDQYSPYSGESVYWKCHQGHEWKNTVSNRTSQGNQCSRCNPGKHSKKQIEWINSIMKKDDIYIQHAENEGEYVIPTVGKVDGYCKETNTVYEFHGSFWHGHPKICNKEDLNPVSKVKNIELFIKTMNRDRQTVALGYNLVVMWEHNYKG